MSVLAAERIKLLSTRSPWWGAGTAILASAGLSALLAATTVGNGQSPTVASTQIGYVLGMAVVMVIAALAVTTEYSVGTIRTTFMAVPRRGSALAAKTTLVAVLAGGIGVVSGFAAWAISLLVLPDADLALSGFDQWRQVAGVGLVYLLACGDRRRSRNSGQEHRCRRLHRVGVVPDGRTAAAGHPRARRDHPPVPSVQCGEGLPDR